MGTASLAGVAVASLIPGAAAQTPAARSGADGPPSITLAPVEVVATTPLPGSGIDRDKVPANVQSLSFHDLVHEGPPSLTQSLTDQVGGVNINATLADPFQPDILYRGFEASPVLGTPQGLAVYQNGVRVNEAFGDTVNWDLIPDIAIDRFDIVSANPVYGLNALGGAAVITMKNGFTYHGFETEGFGGSFGQRGGSFQYGKEAGSFATYLAARLFDEDGWRQFSSNQLRQLYADIGARGERATLHVSFAGADNSLNGEGTTPVQSLRVNRALDFTTPQNNTNELAFLTVNGSYKATDALSFQANAYRREFHQTVVNGNTTRYRACEAGNGLLCQLDGATPLSSTAGAPIPDLSNGGTLPIGQNDRESIHAVTVGGAAQATYTGALFGHDNHLVVGGSIDHSDVDFHSSAEVGIINSSLQVLPSGFIVDTAENSGFVATPVSLAATNDYYGVFITDTLNVTPALAVTVSGRYNLADIALTDRLGTNLSGTSRYSRFNPAIGATYKISAALTAYAGYSEGNRAPTPSEIECSNPNQPCLLPSSLSSDPPTLRQVVSHTYEAGLRGRFGLPLAPGRFTWNAGLFRTDLDDDIYGVATSVSSGFFENVGATRRQGIEAGLAYKDESWSAYLNYSLVEATFESALTLLSPNNPLADDGVVHVRPGDRLPGIPLHQLKVGLDYNVTPEWRVGGVLAYFSDQYLRGDEANQNRPLAGYAVLNLHTAYRINRNFEIFANLQNAFDARYATFGQFGDPAGIGAPGVPAEGSPGINPRFLAPTPPIAAVGGLRMRF
ncbi:MAG TPA: TonB-dependent receptor [Stellaceae bacterium]|nr:TonB-dependent receptor [Stellaceae bacterium]